MSFNSPRPRVRGKPFRLFTDDLPKIDFNRSHLHGSPVRRFPEHTDGRVPSHDGVVKPGIHFDQFSLPSIESSSRTILTPEEPRRPKSHVNVFSANVAQVKKKIRRRHAVKERRADTVIGDTFEREDGNFSENVKWDQDISPKPVLNTVTVKDAFVRTGSVRSFKSKSSKTDKEPVMEEEEKPKSIFKQLLDASAQDSERRKLVEDGFKLFTQDNYVRKPQLRSEDRLIRRKKERVENTPKLDADDQPDSDSFKSSLIGTDQPKDVHAEGTTQHLETGNMATAVKEPIDFTIKPGILKYYSGIGGTQIKHGKHLKPRLIHQDHLTVPSKQDKVGEEVKVTVYAEAPYNKLNALKVESENSHKPRTRRRVNFDKVVEEDAVCSQEHADGKPVNTQEKIPPLTNSKPEFNHHGGEIISLQKSPLPSIRKRDSIRRKSRIRNHETKPVHKSSFPSYTDDTVSEEEPTNQMDNAPKFTKVTERLKDPRIDPFWKEVQAPTEDLNSAKSLANKNAGTDETGIIQANSVTVVSPGKAGRQRVPRSRSIRKHAHPSEPYTPCSTPTGTGSIFGNNTDLDSLSDVTSFFDGIDMDEHVNRGLLGEDLIKAYRLWDRKRKAFPGGLRKIEAPADPYEDYNNLFPKQYGAVRTYKIPPPPQDIKASPEEGASQMNSVYIGSF